MTVEYKTAQAAADVKADTAGAVAATFSTFNTVDHDGDVTLPGAFDNGAAVRLLPAHDWRSYMIGRGTIRTDETKAMFDGRFFLTTEAGLNWYESIRADRATGTPLQEWSYGFDVLEAEPGEVGGQRVRFLKKLKVHEVSPVTLGAGVGTGTIATRARREVLALKAQQVRRELAALGRQKHELEQHAELVALRAGFERHHGGFRGNDVHGFRRAIDPWDSTLAYLGLA